jgi:hypothetical protein
MTRVWPDGDEIDIRAAQAKKPDETLRYAYQKDLNAVPSGPQSVPGLKHPGSSTV